MQLQHSCAVPTSIFCFAMLASSATSSNAVVHQPNIKGTPVMPYTPSSTNQYQLARTTNTVHERICAYTTVEWRMHLHNASICLPSSTAITSRSAIYKQFQNILSDKFASVEGSLRIAFRFGAFTLLISALEPLFTWQVANAVGAVLAALLSCAMCITFCAFTMVLVMVVQCGRWLVELGWAGRGQVGAIVG